MIPDVSMVADQLVIYAMDEAPLSPTFGTTIQLSCIGGTSAATPLWAATAAIADGSSLGWVGFANPTLYAAAAANY